LRLLRVGGSGVAGAAASSEWRGAAGGGEETTLPPAGRDERGRPRLEWEWELELPLQRQGHHRVGGQRGEAGAGAECGGQIYEGEVWDKVLELFCSWSTVKLGIKMKGRGKKHILRNK